MKISFKSKKTKIIAVAAGIAAFVLILTITLCSIKKKNTAKIAFYGVPANQIETIKEKLNEKNLDNKKIPYSFTVLDPSKNLASQADGFDMIIAPMGAASDECASLMSSKKNSKIFLEPSVMRNVTMSVVNKAVRSPDGRKISQMPFYFDGYEALLNLKSAEKTQTKKIDSWRDFESFAEKAKESCPSPILFAGGDSDVLLGTVSCLAESFAGRDKFEDFSKMLAGFKGDYNELLNEEYSDSTHALYEALHRLVSWKQNKLMINETMRLKEEDILSFMTYQNTAIVIMTLSDHRKIPIDIIQMFKTIPDFSKETQLYFPGNLDVSKRSVISSAYCFIPLSDSKYVEPTAQHLMDNAVQEDIARKTGLAPSLAGCRTPDIQSDDLRYWIAASSGSVAPLGDASFSSSAKKEQFAECIRNFILAK